MCITRPVVHIIVRNHGLVYRSERIMHACLCRPTQCEWGHWSRVIICVYCIGHYVGDGDFPFSSSSVFYELNEIL